MRKSFLYIGAALILSAGCNKEVIRSEKSGLITLNLSSEQEVVLTKGSMDCSNFNVYINGTTFLSKPYSESYICSQMAKGVSIPYGTYAIASDNCTSEEAATGLGQTRYWGKTTGISIYSQEPVEVIVNCAMVNGKIQVVFDESFTKDFTNPSIKLSQAGRDVTMTLEQTISSSAYFNVEALGTTISYTIYGTIAGRTLEYSSSVVLSPAKCAIITIKSNHNGLIGPGVDVDDSMKGDDHTIVINPDGIETPDSGNVNAPSITIDTKMDDAVVENVQIGI